MPRIIAPCSRSLMTAVEMGPYEPARASDPATPSEAVAVSTEKYTRASIWAREAGVLGFIEPTCYPHLIANIEQALDEYWYTMKPPRCGSVVLSISETYRHLLRAHEACRSHSPGRATPQCPSLLG